jgi:hypothetical protein
MLMRKFSEGGIAGVSAVNVSALIEVIARLDLDHQLEWPPTWRDARGPSIPVPVSAGFY